MKPACQTSLAESLREAILEVSSNGVACLAVLKESTRLDMVLSEIKILACDCVAIHLHCVLLCWVAVGLYDSKTS